MGLDTIRSQTRPDKINEGDVWARMGDNGTEWYYNYDPNSKDAATNGDFSGFVSAGSSGNTLGGVVVTASKEKQEGGGFWSGVLDVVQTGIDIVGMIPVVGEIADGTNALIYLARGDKANAALSTAAMIPLIGNFATGTKLVVKTAQLTAKARKAADALMLAERILGKGYKEIAPGVFRSADG